jgi:hypothetical protein
VSDPGDEEPRYTGPPPTAPPPPGSPWAPSPYGPPGGWGQPPWPAPGYPAYGWAPGWGPVPPAGPRRPGQVVGAAVLAFVQAAVTAISTFYVFVLASVLGIATAEAGVALPDDARGLATEGRVLAGFGLVGVVALVAGGALVLNNRRRSSWVMLVAALGLEVVLAGYWIVRLLVLGGEIRGEDPTGIFVTVGVLLALLPLTALGLLCSGPARRWFLPAEPAAAAFPR